jgi:acyl-CoA thioester hydrolase
MPLRLCDTTVPPEWIDYNGHMNLAYYVMAFDRGTDALLDRLGVGADYRKATDRTIYVLEAHVLYERELREGDALTVTTRLLDADTRRMHVLHSMWNAAGERVATNELMCLHVDLHGSATGGPRAVRFAPEEQQRVDALLAEHQAEGPPPPEAGRGIEF